jgi:hypothetical protein
MCAMDPQSFATKDSKAVAHGPINILSGKRGRSFSSFDYAAIVRLPRR